MRPVMFAALLVMTPHLAEAECAWVLWQELTAASSSGMAPSEWSVGQAGPSEQACNDAVAAQVLARAAYAKRSNETSPKPDLGQKIEISANEVRVFTSPGILLAYRFLCLPDTVDPRSPKRK